MPPTDSITKSVDDATATTGTVSTAMGARLTGAADSSIDYTLTGTISAALTAAQMGSYTMYDKLPAGTTFLAVPSVRLTGTAASTLSTSDYTVYVNGAVWTGGTAPDGATVQIAMTSSGLTKLANAKAADPTATVVATIQVRATAGTGVLANSAQLVPSNAWWQAVTGSSSATYNPDASASGGGDTPTQDRTTAGGTTAVSTTITSATVSTKLGSATVTKTDAATGAVLPNAEFALYAKIIAQANPATPTAASCAGVVTDETYRVMSGLTTNASGTLTITGLQTSNFYDNVQQPASNGQYIVYCLVETTAPAGYNLLAEPVGFDVPSTSTPVALAVKDQKLTFAGTLPLTGRSGVGVYRTAGFALLGVGLGWYGWMRRRAGHEHD